MKHLAYIATLGGRAAARLEQCAPSGRTVMIGLALALCFACTGCGTTKARTIDGAGMYVAKSGALAIGKVSVVAVPEKEDSAIIKYAEDTAFLSPSTKTHAIDIFLTGTNSTENVTGIVKAICNAFVAVAPATATTTPNPQSATHPEQEASSESKSATHPEQEASSRLPGIGPETEK